MTNGPHKYTNHLAGETSPYLLQHAHNPVDWYPWGREALDRARQQDRPIFLSIGYAACHWCHVMERESFENETIAAVVNENFVPVKVDREERPDLDDVYMTATQMMTGSGGWPMSVFLTPDLKPFYAGTYFPPEDGMFGRPGFKTLCRELGRAWRERRPEVERLAAEQAEAVRRALEGGGHPAAFDPQSADRVLAQAAQPLVSDFDPVNGGFGGAPKFPPAMRLAILIRLLERSPAPQIRGVIQTTLDRMGRGGMYDQVGGGFHRYSVDERWLVPHFEKMLYDNALLAWVYLDAGTVLEDPARHRLARQILDDVRREFVHPDGGFYSTLDADSEGEEGKYYLWSPEEVAAVLGEADAERFEKIFDITRRGNFEGKNIPNLLARGLPEWAADLAIPLPDLYVQVDTFRERLREARSERVPPGLDDKILASWNGLMIRAFARAYELLGDAAYLAAAERAADFVLSRMQVDGRLRRSFRAGQAPLNGYLDDYACMAVGLLHLYAASRADRWLDAARSLLDSMDRWFWDEPSGLYFFTSHDHEELIARIRDSYDNAVPSGNGMAVLAHAHMASLTGEASHRERAGRMIAALLPQIERLPVGFPTFLLAMDVLPGQGPRVRIRPASSPDEVPAGESFQVRLLVEVPAGWHLNPPATGPGEETATRLELEAPRGFRLADVTYPAVAASGAPGGAPAPGGYSGAFELAASVETDVALSAGDYSLDFVLNSQACSERECLPPAAARASVPVRVIGSE